MEQATSSLTTTREADLRRYCSMGLGAAVLAGAVTTSDASVVYTNYNNQIYGDTNAADTTATRYDFDANKDGTNDFSFFLRNETATPAGNYTRITGGVTGSTLKAVNVVGFASSGFDYASRLTAGAAIGATRAFLTLSRTAASNIYLQPASLAFGPGYPNSKWSTNATKSGYLGFSFTLADGIHYGFIGMTVGPQGLPGNLSRAISIGGIAYETTPGLAITAFGPVGAIPEPSSLAMLALGGAGLAAYRNRRKKAATVA